MSSEPQGFRLREWMAGIGVLALACAFWRNAADASLRWFIPMTLLVAGASFAVGRRYVPLKTRDAARLPWVPIFLARVTCIATLAAILGMVGATEHWRDIFEGEVPWPSDPGWLDVQLFRLHDWLDACNPPPPNHMKLHGEMHTVWFILTFASLLVSATGGFVLGAASKFLPRDAALIAGLARAGLRFFRLAGCAAKRFGTRMCGRELKAKPFPENERRDEPLASEHHV